MRPGRPVAALLLCAGLFAGCTSSPQATPTSSSATVPSSTDASVSTSSVSTSSAGGTSSSAGTTSTAPPSTSSPAPSSSPTTRPSTTPRTRSTATPTVTVTTLVSGLDVPWDLAFAPDGTMVFDQRGGGLSARLTSGRIVQIDTDLDDLWVSGETGLMGLAVDPQFATNRKLYACFGHQDAQGATDVRIAAFTVAADWSSAQRQDQPLLTGIGTSSGRHGGCRIRFDATGLLYVGTGDAAIGTNPQDLASLNGKVLRLTTSGQPAPGNPFLSSSTPASRFVYSYGHRNVQGLALRPGTDDMWSVEQGTSVDDEVNRPVAGGNFGYDPVPKNGATASYNESVPMTDPALGDVVAAVASTGDHTDAWSGGTWITGAEWGKWDGALAVAALKATKLELLTIDAADKLTATESLPALDGTHGRLRTVVQGPDGALYVATSDADGADEILRVAAS